MQPSYLQTQDWMDFKALHGWSHHKIGEIFVLERQLPGKQKMLYVPEVVLPDDPKAFLDELRKLGLQRKAMFIRLEIFEEIITDGGFSKSSESASALPGEAKERSSAFGKPTYDLVKGGGFIKSFEDVQPEWRQWVDISQPESDILAQMKPKGRYNIKVAEKNSVKILQASGDQPSSTKLVERVHQLYIDAALRDKFSARTLAYFDNLVKKMGGKTKVLLATLDDQDLAGMILVIHGGYASYLYGGSSNQSRNVMAPYLLHWSAIQIAKEAGAKVYDLLAVAPVTADSLSLIANSKGQDANSSSLIANSRGQDADSISPMANSQNPTAISHEPSAISQSAPAMSHELSAISHKYAGLSRFKTQFGGQTIHLAGSFDLPLKPIWYKIFSLGERIRRK